MHLQLHLHVQLHLQLHVQLHVHLHLHLHLHGHLHGQMSAQPALLYAAAAVWQWGKGADYLPVSPTGFPAGLCPVGSRFLLFMVDVPSVMLLSSGTVEGCG